MQGNFSTRGRDLGRTFKIQGGFYSSCKDVVEQNMFSWKVNGMEKTEVEGEQKKTDCHRQTAVW